MAKNKKAALSHQLREQLVLGTPQTYWGVVSVGSNLEPVRHIVESWDEAVSLMSDPRFRLRLFTTREDAAAFIKEPNAPRWYQEEDVGAGADAEEDDEEQEAPPAQAARGLFGGGGAHDGGGAASASAAASVYVAPAARAGRSSAGADGRGTNLFGAVPPRRPRGGGGREQNGPSRSHPRPTSEWIDRKIKEIRPDCGASELDVIQRQVIHDVLARKCNVFLTGSGGVGKSFVTKLLIDLLKAHYRENYTWRVCVCASTGIAATHVDGCTVHSAMGIGIPYKYQDFGRIFGCDKNNERRWSQHFEILFIDEVSMISGEMLDGLDDTLRRVRHNEAQAFGGLQLVFVGDMAQLPPIQERLQRYKAEDFLPRSAWTFQRREEFWNLPVVLSESSAQQEPLFTNRGFVVQSDAWWNADLRIVELTKVFRQKDADFIAALNRMRKGEATPLDVEWMNRHFFYGPQRQPQQPQLLQSPPPRPLQSPPPQSLLATQPVPSPAAKGAASPTPGARVVPVHPDEPPPDPDPLHLYARNADVDRWNAQKMAALPYEEKTYHSYDFVDHDFAGVVDRFGPEPFWMRESTYREGVRQLRGNSTFYNRLLAVENLKLKVGSKVILLKNLDLKSDQRLVNGSIGTIIRWAKGPEEATYDSVLAIDGKAGGTGSPSKEQRRSAVVYHSDYVERWLAANAAKVPIVRFLNGRVKAIIPEMFTEEIVGVGASCRIQIPLRIAFAISIHKSQGMTLDEALVDIEHCFAGGQTYVAISRVGPREGLRFKTPLTMRRIITERTFLEWEALRLEMEQRRAAVLEALPPAKRPAVESLGLKSLHNYAQDALEGADGAPVQGPMLRQRLAALKHTLGKLKPTRAEKANGAIRHWQTLPWLRDGNGYRSSMPLPVQSPPAAAAHAQAST